MVCARLDWVIEQSGVRFFSLWLSNPMFSSKLPKPAPFLLPAHTSRKAWRATPGGADLTLNLQTSFVVANEFFQQLVFIFWRLNQLGTDYGLHGQIIPRWHTG
jgi:hypothetical protein